MSLVPKDLFHCFTRLSAIMLLCTCAWAVQADSLYMILRHGPGESYPVVHEMPKDHRMKPVLIQQGWVLLEGEGKSGWLPEGELQETQSISKALLWDMKRQSKEQTIAIDSGLSTLSSWMLSVSQTGKTYEFGLGYQTSSSGLSHWRLLEGRVTHAFKKIGSADVVASLTAGIGSSSKGDRHWGDTGTKEQQTPVLGAEIGIRQSISQGLSLFIKARYDTALDANRASYGSAILGWKLHI